MKIEVDEEYYNYLVLESQKWSVAQEVLEEIENSTLQNRDNFIRMFRGLMETKVIK